MATVFLTGGSGFIGRHVAAELVSGGHDVRALARSAEGALAVEAIGAHAVHGDLLRAGSWQDEATSADWVIHLGSPSPFGGRLGSKRAEEYSRVRTAVDRALFDTLAHARVKRAVYVSGFSYYGASGCTPITEDVEPHPYALGKVLADAFDLVEPHLLMGVPIVCAFPGVVYGNGSWFAEHVIRPLLAGRPVVRFGRTAPLQPTIHVRDCARAIVHLAQHGRVGGRYFLANDQPARLDEIAAELARQLGRRLRVLTLPRALAPLLLGPLLAEYGERDAVLSNARLRALGFSFLYPTIADGAREVAGGLHV
jgi:nucleoside-diphosphate-sugar epimerase